MTVNTTNITSGPYTGNGITDTFSYTFRVENKNQLQVYETTDSGIETLLTVDTDYTVNEVGDDAGGTITRVAGALPSNYTWYIRSNYQSTQLTAFSSQGAFLPAVHESAFDKLTFLIQQINDRNDRSLRFSDSYPGGATAELPAPISQYYLRWNSAGDGLESSPGVIVGEAVVIFATVADMDADTTLTLGMKVRTLGYNTIGDGGDNDYTIVAALTGTDDGGSYLDLSGSGLQAQGLFPGGRVNAAQFGAVADYVPNSSTGTDQSTKFNNALIFAAGNDMGAVYVKPGRYRISATVDVLTGTGLICEDNIGIMDDGLWTDDNHCWFVGVGTGPKVHAVDQDDLGGGYEMGGEVANPDSANAYTASHGTGSDNYRLLDFTNGDASGATKATVKNFSVLIRVNYYAKLEGIIATFNYDGDACFLNDGTDFGDDWDVGIWLLNGDKALITSSSAWGYWRMAGLLFTNITTSELATGQAERGEIDNCSFRGYRGVAIRNTTGHTATASTTTTVEIAWSASHLWDTAGSFFVANDQAYTYTGLSFSGDKLTFTGVTPDASGVSAGNEVYRNDVANFGLATFMFRNCFITDMLHASQRYVVDDYFGVNAFDYQAAGFEYSGRHQRQMTMWNCTFRSREDCNMFLHDCRDLQIFGGHMEANNAVDDVGASLPRANRILALQEASASHSASYVTKGARTFQLYGTNISDDVDASPVWGTSPSKFGNGLCDPLTSFNLVYQFGISDENGNGDTMGQRLNWQPRMRTTSAYNGYVAVFRDNNVDSTELPVGQLIPVFTGAPANAPDRREIRSVYQDATNAWRYTIFADGGSNPEMAGTWRAVGKSGEDTTGDEFFLFQRCDV